MSDILSEHFLKETLQFTPEFEGAFPTALADISKTLSRFEMESDPSLLLQIRQGILIISEVMAKQGRRFGQMTIFAGRFTKSPFDKIAIEGVMDNQSNVAVTAVTCAPSQSKGFLFVSHRDETEDCEVIRMFDADGDYVDGQTNKGVGKSMFMDYVELNLAVKGGLFHPSELNLFLPLVPPAKPQPVEVQANGQTCHK
jgi:hypothetical protein